MDRAAQVRCDRRRRRGSPELAFPRRRRAWTCRSSSNSMLWGSNRPVLGSGRFSTTCVIHLGSKQGLGMLGVAGLTAVAALCSGARRSARAGRLWGSDPGAGGSACVRRAKAHLGRVRAWLGCTAEGSPRRWVALGHRRTTFTQSRPRFGIDSSLGSIHATQLIFTGPWISLAACGVVRPLWCGGTVNHGEAFYTHGGIKQGNEGSGVSLTTTGSCGGTTLV